MCFEMYGDADHRDPKTSLGAKDTQSAGGVIPYHHSTQVGVINFHYIHHFD